MIVFLTLCYLAILALLIKLKVIQLNLWWKLSPLVWMAFLFIALFVPMQWGAPAGAITSYQTVIEIIPNVSGEVINVPVKPRVPLRKGTVLFKIDPRPFRYKVAQVEAGVELTTVNLDRAKKLAKKDFASKYDVDRLTAELKGLQAQLADAQYNLAQTVVRAPGDGYVLGLTLRPGQRVANLPLRSWVAFVDYSQQYLVVGVNQILLRHVKEGQEVEIAFKLFPGEVLKAKVKDVVYMNAQGQLAPSGTLPQAPTARDPILPYAVALELEDEDIVKEVLQQQILPGGAMGTAAIYTESAKVSHVIRKVMIRMEAWLNYIIPN